MTANGNGGLEPTPAVADAPMAPAPKRGAGAGSLLLGRVLVAVAGWAGTIVIARTLSPSGWGTLAFVFGLMGMVGLMADLQVGKIVLRDVIAAGDSAGSMVGTYLLMRLTVGVVSLALSIGFVLAAGYESRVVWTTVVLGVDFLFASPAHAALVWFQARLSLRPVAVGMAVGAFFQLSTILAIAFATVGSPPAFAAAYVLADVVWLVWELGALRRLGLRLHFSIDLKKWRAWLKEAVPLAIGFGLASLYYKLDVVVLGQLDSLRAVGQYSIGYKFADVAIFVPLALLTPVLTLMVSAWPHDTTAIREHFRRTAMLLGCAAMVIAVGFALVAEPLIELLYGGQYADSVGAARFLVAGAAIQFFSQLCFVTLVTLGRNWPYVLAGLTGVLLNIVLNVVLIPPYSFNGSAAATIVTEVFVLLLLLVALGRTSNVIAIPWLALALLTVAGAAMVLIYLATVSYVPWPASAVAASGGFVGVLYFAHLDGRRALWTLRDYLRFEHITEDTVLAGPQVTTQPPDQETDTA